MDIHLYLHDQRDHEVITLLNKILKKEDKIMADISELNELMSSISSEVDKVSTDTDGLLEKLNSMPTGGLTPEQQAALDSAVESATSISTRLQALDQKVPDRLPGT